MSAGSDWLASYLDSMPLVGEAVRFDLSAYRSTVTREMLQARLRKTPLAFGVGEGLLAANLTSDGAALAVDAAELTAANAEVGARLIAGAAGSVHYLRRMKAIRARLDRLARRVAGTLRQGQTPRPATLIAYLDASAADQAIGGLKFCLPHDLKTRLKGWFDDSAVVEALLSPDGPSLWTELKARELNLAHLRLIGPTEPYRRRLERHRRAFGYLSDEDVGFREHEATDAIDARLAAAGADGRVGLARARRALRAAVQIDRERKLIARRRFAERLAEGAGGATAMLLVSHVLLARALAAHEDANRQGKMRLLRDLRDLALLGGLDLEQASLRDFVQCCTSFGCVEPVLPSR